MSTPPDIKITEDYLKQDEKKNRAMIDEWLRKNKPTVITPTAQAQKLTSPGQEKEKEVPQEVKKAKAINKKFQEYFSQQKPDKEKELSVKDFDKVEHYFDYFEALKIRNKLKRD